MNVPSFNSANARSSSACVFITIGPYQATGSSIGLPDTNRKRIPSSPACTVISSPLSNRTSDRFPVRSRISASFPSTAFSVSTPKRLRRGAEGSRALEHVGEGVPAGLDRQRLAPPRRDEDVEIARVGGNPLDRTAPTPEVSADNPDAGAVVVDDLRNFGGLDVLVARRRHLQG